LHGYRNERLARGAMVERNTTRQNACDALRSFGSTRLNSPTVSHVYPDATRLSVSGCGDGLGEAAQGSIGSADGIADEGTRKVLSWRVSNTMDADFCIEALEEALERFGKPEIFNTDSKNDGVGNLSAIPS
jgi:hypothetical protein